MKKDPLGREYPVVLPISTNPVLQRHCAILKRIGFVVVSTLSITKLLNQQETACIHLGSKRSFLMRRRSVFHHIFPPNSKKVLCCIWWKVERQIFVLVPLFCLPKRKHCKQPVHRKKNWMTSVSLNIMRTSTAEIDHVQNQNITRKVVWAKGWTADSAHFRLD